MMRGSDDNVDSPVKRNVVEKRINYVEKQNLCEITDPKGEL